MVAKSKTWKDKFERACAHGLPKVQPITGKLRRTWGEGTFVIPSPREVDALMKKVPRGKLTTINDIRGVLAKRHHATMACPITTGIFSWLAAHQAEEERAKGKDRITPYWRTLKTGGEVNPKYPGGIPIQKMFLEGEGHLVTTRGKKTRVEDYETKLVRRRKNI